MNKKIWSGMIIGLALLGCILIVVNNAKEEPQSNISSSLNGIALHNLQDDKLMNVAYTDKPTVLSFFTSWCTYCNMDAPKMVALYEKYKDRVNVYGVNLIDRDEREEVVKYVERHEIPYPVLLDANGDVFRQYNGRGFPTLYFIDRSGKVTDAIIGSSEMDTIEAAFKKLAKHG
ncbi:TlpA family protein disulfide reductase [Paenibacillus sp. J5C_2022]|uniref:TlpA family protein disulfide reductase n=1 Tax=Paenibacillus sp. J5C2022 TaxID=2977129 RepID=UPI0021D04FD5|nr:TlpA disulfide reductase family protein [Paenibacillus sp. J5C2022]MCU6711769.1 TlpA family protein disulfide reductase [Paenibacillus sp. J5C2022]